MTPRKRKPEPAHEPIYRITEGRHERRCQKCSRQTKFRVVYDYRRDSQTIIPRCLYHLVPWAARHGLAIPRAVLRALAAEEERGR